MLKPLADSWPTYSGDYTGRRYSSLTQVNQTTVKNLTLAWTRRLAAGSGAGGGGGFGGGGGGGGGAPVIVGGEGTEDLHDRRAERQGRHPAGERHPLRHGARQRLGASTRATAASCGATSGRPSGGTHIGNRGAAMWNNYLFFETPDNYLVSLDARTGKERWHVEIADFDQQYFSTMAPIVVDNHVLVGTGNDLDAPGFLQSYDPETGKRKWIFYTVPMKPGDPGLDTWPSLDAARHGGGQVWIPGVYDPETKLYIFGTGNPTPGYTGVGRKGDNLFTCSLVAVNVDTGKMAWYFQTSPHDTHDWDSAQTPILIDGDDQRQAAQARLDRGAQRLLLHGRSRDRRARRHREVRRRRRTGRKDIRPRRVSRSRIPRRKRRFPARWCRRSKAASSTGSRRRIRRTPACSTRRRTTASTSSI